MGIFKWIKRTAVGTPDNTISKIDLLKPYRGLRVDYFAPVVRYGVSIIFLIIIMPAGIFNLVSALLTLTFKPYITVANEAPFVAANLIISAISGISGLGGGLLIIISMNRRIGNELHGARVLDQTLKVYQFFDAHFQGVIKEIIKVQDPLKQKIISGQRGKLRVEAEDKTAEVRRTKKGVIPSLARLATGGKYKGMKQSTEKFSIRTRDMTPDELATMRKMSMYMIGWTERSVKSLRHEIYLSEAENEGDIWKFHEGSISYRSAIVGASVATCQVGILGELALLSEIIPIVYPVGDDNQYHDRLEEVGYTSITRQDLVEIRKSADGLMSVELAIENNALRNHLKSQTEAYEKKGGIMDMAAKQAAKIDELRQEGLAEDPEEKPTRVSKKVIALVVGLIVVVVVLGVYFWFVGIHPPPRINP